jgi:autoinducer 2-degrading protein
MEDAAAHKQTPHYAQWRETVADWMAEPRQGVPYTGLYPAS